MNNEYFMKLALIEADKAYLKGEIPVGAVIVKNNEVIARAYNTRDKEQQVICHAEINVLMKACKKEKNWRLNNCEIYVTMQPCPMCAAAIQQARIKKIVYGASTFNEKYKKFMSELFNNEKDVCIIGNVLDEECSLLINKFFYNKRKDT